MHDSAVGPTLIPTHAQDGPPLRNACRSLGRDRVRACGQFPGLLTSVHGWAEVAAHRAKWTCAECRPTPANPGEAEPRCGICRIHAHVTCRPHRVWPDNVPWAGSRGCVDVGKWRVTPVTSTCTHSQRLPDSMPFLTLPWRSVSWVSCFSFG